MSPTAKRIFELAANSGLEPRRVRRTLADVCGISPQAVRDWQQGHTKNIKHEYLVKVAKYFGVSTHYLLTGEPEAPNSQDNEAFLKAWQLWQGLSPDQQDAFYQMLQSMSDKQ